MSTNSRLEYLYARCMNGSATSQEREEFMQLIKMPENEPIARLLLSKAFRESKELEDITEEMATTILQAIFSTDVPLKEAVVIPLQPDKKIYRIEGKWWAIAATVVLLISGGYFFFLNKWHGETAKVAQAQPFKNDIPPGGDRAVLTLGNGQQILLDSAANGVLAEQGGAKIDKIGAGQLAYSSSATKNERDVIYNTLSTPRGGRYRLILPDGSVVWLNAASSIVYPTAFNGTKRMVNITGEAYFEVKHMTGRPFIVKVANQEIEDLGTHFNVNAYADEPDMKTTLLEGSVRIGTTILRPGQEVVLNPLGYIHVVEDADVDKIMAWKNNLFIFSKDDIGTIMRQLSKWYNVDIEYRGNMNVGHFSGIISRNNNISQVLKMLESTGGVKFEIEGTKVIVLP